jgi:hypothetical protein
MNINKMILIGQGSNRKVFSIDNHPNIVIKVPIFSSDENYQEHERYRASLKSNHKFHNKLAPCRILKNGWLVMKKVQCVTEQLSPRKGSFGLFRVKDNKNKLNISKRIKNYHLINNASGIYKNRLVLYDYDEENISM